MDGGEGAPSRGEDTPGRRSRSAPASGGSARERGSTRTSLSDMLGLHGGRCRVSSRVSQERGEEFQPLREGAEAELQEDEVGEVDEVGDPSSLRKGEGEQAAGAAGTVDERLTRLVHMIPEVPEAELSPPHSGGGGGRRTQEPAPVEEAPSWYYADASMAQLGPVDGATLRRMVGEGALSGTTPVWAATLANWTPLAEVPELAAPHNGAANDATDGAAAIRGSLVARRLLLRGDSSSSCCSSAAPPASPHMPSTHRVHMVEWSTDSSLLENLPASPPPSPPASASEPPAKVGELGGGALGWLVSALCKLSGSIAAEARLFAREPYDPIAKLFAYAPAWWGNVSYGQYVLQMVAYQMWPG